MRRSHTKWSRVKPEKQLENMPTAVGDMLTNTVSNQVLSQGKDIYMSYRNRELS